MVFETYRCLCIALYVLIRTCIIMVVVTIKRIALIVTYRKRGEHHAFTNSDV